MEEETKRPQTMMQALEDRWKKTRDHVNSYPYVWASYIFVFGGLGVITAYRSRALRKAEDDLLRLQEKLKRAITAREAAEAMEEARTGKL